MRIKVATRVRPYENMVVIVGIGAYVCKIDFDSKEVEVKKEKWTEARFMEFEFSNNDLRFDSGRKIMMRSIVNKHIDNVTSPDGKLVEYNMYVEYFCGKTGLHKHSPAVREAYLSVSENSNQMPQGRVCGFGEEHESFSDYTLSVKLFMKYK